MQIAELWLSFNCKKVTLFGNESWKKLFFNGTSRFYIQIKGILKRWWKGKFLFYE